MGKKLRLVKFYAYRLKIMIPTRIFIHHVFVTAGHCRTTHIDALSMTSGVLY